jgi:hypothetical protein
MTFKNILAYLAETLQNIFGKKGGKTIYGGEQDFTNFF